MARDNKIEARLLEWAEWLKVGDGSGYAVKSVLHEDWSPPGKGTTPTMKVSSAGREVRATDAAVRDLRPALKATVVARYVLRMSNEEAAAVLECQANTVCTRIEEAHRVLAGSFCNIEQVR